MKTAISIPDKLFIEADAFAQASGWSRSELYATALKEFLSRRDEARITERLNAVYGSEKPAESRVLPAPARLVSSRADLW